MPITRILTLLYTTTMRETGEEEPWYCAIFGNPNSQTVFDLHGVEWNWMKKTTSQHLHVPVSKTGSRNTLHAFLKSTSSLLRKIGEIINLLVSTVVAMETYDSGQQDFPQAYTRSFVMVEEFSLMYESHLTTLKFVNSKRTTSCHGSVLSSGGES